jgi:hypothetical protein
MHAVIWLQGRTGVEVVLGEGLTVAEKAGRWALGVWWWAFVVETCESGWKKSFGTMGSADGCVCAWRMDACYLVREVRASSVSWKGVSGRCSLVVRHLVEDSASREVTSEAGMAEMGLVMRRRLRRQKRLPFGFHAGDGAVIGVHGRESQWV